MSSAEPDSVAANVAQWTATNAEFTDGDGRTQWWNDRRPSRGACSASPTSGSATSPASTSSSSAAAPRTARRGSRALGARVVGVDPTPAQLETARRMQRETGIEFPLVEAPAEAVPLPDDVVRPRVLRVRRVALGRSRRSGSPRPRACSVPAAASSSSRTRRSRTSARRTRTSSRSRTARPSAVRAVTARSGRSTPASSSTSRTATGSASCATNGFVVDALHELQAPATTRRRTSTTSRFPSSGRAGGRARISGRRSKT